MAVAGDPVSPLVFYFGACAGGVWKTVDGGVQWENVSDGYFRRGSVGAVAVADSDPNVVYAGMGEACIRGNVSQGDGVYGSTDGGRTWRHLGLEDTRHIARVRVHPRDPELVYVAALGNAFGANAERGVYRSRDGGKSWEQVLSRGEDAGCCDLSMDPNNPRILFAAFWQARRRPWHFSSGGEGSGLFKSADGGDTWTGVSGNPGFPAGVKGRIGVAVSPARDGRVWAVVEAEEEGLFRSDDGGGTWERVCDDANLTMRPWYYSHVFADPQDAETVYVLNIDAWKSVDGGRTFEKWPVPHGDSHDLWIDPKDPRRMIEGNDGGACVSYNGGASWSTLYNQPTAQFYHVTTDSRFPYRVYGPQQDWGTISVPSRSGADAINSGEWYVVGGGESGHLAVRQDDPEVVYASDILGHITRYDHRAGEARNISVWPEDPTGWSAEEQRYRFQWDFPVMVSPHDAKVLYTAGNVVFRSRDEGSSWEAISPDLTRNDPEKLGRSGGPIKGDNVSTEYYCTVFALAESPVERGVLWAGSDDGLVHVSKDVGEGWEKVTPPELPEWATVCTIEPSPHVAGAAYFAATNYRLGDDRPYLFKTGDYGKSWQRICAGIPEDDFTRVVREDPERRGLLFAGSETGVYVSLDDGGSWQSLRLNLPVTPVYDLAVKDGDLVAGTHGRGFWILDDVSPLRQITEEASKKGVLLFKPRRGVRFRVKRGDPSKAGRGRNYQFTGAMVSAYVPERRAEGPPGRRYLDAGTNAPNGVAVYYHLPDGSTDEVTLTFLDGQGSEITSFSSAAQEGEAGEENRARAPSEAGGNRFVWDMRYPEAVKVPGDETAQHGVAGPLSPPGNYQVRLQAGGQTFMEESFEIVKDPRSSATQGELEAQFRLLVEIRDKLSEAHGAVNRLRDLRRQLQEWERRLEGSASAAGFKAAAAGVNEKLAEVEEELIQTRVRVWRENIAYPVKLNARLAALAGVVGSAEAGPTRQSYQVFEVLAGRVDEARRRLEEVERSDVAGLNRMIEGVGVEGRG